MKLEQQIAIHLSAHKELTVSESVTKTFRQWIISKGGRCTPTGDVITPKGSTIHIVKASKPHAYRISLEVLKKAVMPKDRELELEEVAS